MWCVPPNPTGDPPLSPTLVGLARLLRLLPVVPPLRLLLLRHALVLPQGLHLAPHDGHAEAGDEDEGDDVQKRRLRGIPNEHHGDGGDKGEGVRNKGCVEVPENKIKSISSSV